jgi:hypothetical protein
MYRKDYRSYIGLLRSREARPSFARVEALIAATPTRNLSAVPFFAKTFSSLFVIGVIGTALWMLTSKAPHNKIPQSRSGIEVNSSEYSIQPQFPKFATRHKIRLLGIASPGFPILGSSASEHIADSELSLASVPLPNIVIAHSPITHNTLPVASITIADSEKESKSNFFVMVSGTISQQVSTNAAFRQLSFSDAFLGIGYSLSQHASIRVLAGEEEFNAPSNTTTNSISFRDTTFVHNGQSYQNVIGEVQSTNLPVLTRVFWLGASDRYTLGDEASPIHPFGELMAGGSTDGFLTHQSLGAEWTLGSRIDFDLLFQASELLPPGSTWLTKVGFSAELAYRW